MKIQTLFLLAMLATGILCEALPYNKLDVINRQLFVLLDTGYQTDSVVNLLKGIGAALRDDLDSLVDTWNTKEDSFLATINTDISLVKTNAAACDKISMNIDSLERQRAKYVNLVQAADDSIATNRENLGQKARARCEANLIFIERLKDNKESLDLLTYLKGKLSDPSFKAYLTQNNGAFVELQSHYAKSPKTMLGLITKHHLIAFFSNKNSAKESQDVDARSESEIGAGHVDNEKAALKLERYASASAEIGDVEVFVGKLVVLIETLIENIQKSSENLKTAEFNSVHDFAEWKATVERETLVLNKFISAWSDEIRSLDTTLRQFYEARNECGASVCSLDAEINSIRVEYNHDRTFYKASRDSLIATLQKIEGVIRLYVKKVMKNAGPQYSAGIEEFLKTRVYNEENPDFGNPNAVAVPDSDFSNYCAAVEKPASVDPVVPAAKDNVFDDEKPINNDPAPIFARPIVDEQSTEEEEEEVIEEEETVQEEEETFQEKEETVVVQEEEESSEVESSISEDEENLEEESSGAGEEDIVEEEEDSEEATVEVIIIPVEESSVATSDSEEEYEEEIVEEEEESDEEPKVEVTVIPIKEPSVETTDESEEESEAGYEEEVIEEEEEAWSDEIQGEEQIDRQFLA